MAATIPTVVVELVEPWPEDLQWVQEVDNKLSPQEVQIDFSEDLQLNGVIEGDEQQAPESVESEDSELVQEFDNRPQEQTKEVQSNTFSDDLQLNGVMESDSQQGPESLLNDVVANVPVDKPRVSSRHLFEQSGLVQENCVLQCENPQQDDGLWFKGHTPLPSDEVSH